MFHPRITVLKSRYIYRFVGYKVKLQMRGEGEAASRVVSGPDPDRFYCPFPGCNRSFAELWRLKVHFRAPPDVRGSGKERGHGTELKYCPKCGKELKPGKHHVGCTAGKSAPRQAAKRQKQMSSTTETGDWVTQSSPSDSVDFGEDEEDDDSIRERSRYSNLESAVRRRASRTQRRQSGKSSSGAPAKECRLENHLKRSSGGAGIKTEENGELLFTDKRNSDYPYSIGGEELPFLDAIDSKDMPREYDKEHLLPDLHDLQKDAVRAPSPPPLPPDWELGPSLPSGGAGLLFDFDQFDEAKRPRLGGAGGVGEPLMTVTSAMNPSEVSNPSDDYIWQILFAGENDPVPKRVTAHLHNPIDRAGVSPDLVGMFDDIPDDIMGNDLDFPSNSKDRHVPPPPPEAWEMAGKKEEEGQTVTVTYVVKDGQYVVKRVEPTTGGD